MYRMKCALFCRVFYEEDAGFMYLLKFPSHPGTYLYSDVDARRAALFVTVLDTIMTLYDPCIPEVPGKPLNIKITANTTLNNLFVFRCIFISISLL